eukprot:scaffold1984_cov162-Amphora_coffeaeformis.AAC.1
MNNNLASTASTSAAAAVPIARGVEYRCGDCGTKTVIKGGDPIRCRQCGFRILYKTRTKRCAYPYTYVFTVSEASEQISKLIQFEAR